MYRDRIEVINPGGLFGRININELGIARTEVRNSVLVNCLEILEIAENRHSGIPTIRLEMEKSDLPAPLFEDIRGEFKVTLRNHFESILEYCKKPRSKGEIAEFLDVGIDYAMANKVTPLIEAGKLVLTMPDKPQSKNQKYRTV